jgi:hypothetical protein
MKETAVVVQKAYDFVLWIVPKVEKFPRSYRIMIGGPLVQASIEMLLYLVDAAYQTRNSVALAAASRETNRVRFLVRLSKDLRAINLDAHEFASRALEEIGRMTGGWLKSRRPLEAGG